MVQYQDEERFSRGRVMMTEAKARQSPGSPAAASKSGSSLDPDRWVQDHADALFGYAVLRVRDRATAEDLVQETFFAAIKAKSSFAGRSSERAWLFGILRNKLSDYYRRQSREVALADLEAALPEEQDSFGATGPGKDGWLPGRGPKAWKTPEEVLVSKEFQTVLQDCLMGLPVKIAQAFVLREIDGATSDEICKDLGVSPNNAWVMLHRARMGLRRCLEANWFGNKRKGK